MKFNVQTLSFLVFIFFFFLFIIIIIIIIIIIFFFTGCMYVRKKLYIYTEQM